jgi:hypothetical protein
MKKWMAGSCMAETTAHRNSVHKPRERAHFEDVGMDGNMFFKTDFRDMGCENAN